MAANIPTWAKQFPKYSLYDKYDVARSGLIDTAETPQDKKNLKKDLEKLRQEYLALKAAQAPTGAAAIKAIQERTSPKGVAAAEAAARAAIAKKYPGLTIPEVKKGTMQSPDLARSKNKNFGR
jgi:hypothetical protein